MVRDLGRRRPIVCLVTDRRRLCHGCDAARARQCVVEQVRQAVAAGVDLLSVRERDLDGAPLAALVAEAVEIARGTTTRVTVNDRLDVAIAAGAAGVHLRADSMPVAAARRIAPEGFLIGRSVHAPDEAAANGDADYLIAGTVFASVSKPGVESLGETGLAAIVRASRVPVLAIGGVTLETMPQIAAAGAAGFAAIGLFVLRLVALAQDGPCRAIPLRPVVDAARARFDSVKTAS